MPVSTADWLAHTVRSPFALTKPKNLGVAVSGGGDSTALLLLLDDWRQQGGPELAVVTVDHGLRAEAREEAAGVAALCARLGVPHDLLHWTWDGRGNLPDAGRRGRYALIGEWARGRGIGIVALGHTADDQAETFLMRLARGSGVDGLSGMAVRRMAGGVEWVRPVLGLRREELRQFLRERGVSWVEDPTNEDDAFDRVKARRALEVLGPLGLEPETLIQTAHWMGRARDVLDDAALDLARRAVRIEAGDVSIERTAFVLARNETQNRLLSHSVRWVSGGAYRPRIAALTDALVALLGRRQTTLAGCILFGRAGEFRVTRELNAVRDLSCPTDAIWDGRWRLTGPHAPGLTVRALGEAGLRVCPDWRATRMPRVSLLSSPAVWEGERLVAAPLAGNPNGWAADLAEGPEDFFTSLIVH